jgi:hypothetical protein
MSLYESETYNNSIQREIFILLLIDIGLNYRNDAECAVYKVCNNPKYIKESSKEVIL